MSTPEKLIPFRAQSESFTVFKDEGCYYVDKTGFIRHLIENGDKICVCTRPRRFGKTLMLKTLKAFFEFAYDREGNIVDNRRYFEGLKVMQSSDRVLAHMGQYPVIFLSLKDVKGDSYALICDQMRSAIYQACREHLDLHQNQSLLPGEQAEFQHYLEKTPTESEIMGFLDSMSAWLNRTTHRKVVILIDEYDVPLQQAAIYDNHHPGSNLYESTVRLVGNFISAGFKSNDNLAYGIITGCMRVAKESIFTGMNNPGVITVLDGIPDEFWGFTEPEVKAMLAYYGLEDRYQDIEAWYDGYTYSGRKVFNPWSLLNAIRGLVNGYGNDAIQPYWVMTSSNDIIDDMIDSHPMYREALAKLMNGDTKRVPVYKDLSYRDLKTRPDSIWSFLLFTGYLKAVRIMRNSDNLLEAEVAIPNAEIKSVMTSAMRHWWNDIQLRGYPAQTLIKAMTSGDIETLERELRIVLNDSTSVFDYNEAFYHGMLVGLLGNVTRVRSNDEYGEGRPDIVALTEDKGILIEVKCVTPKALEQAMKSHPEADEFDIIDACVATKLDEAAKQITDRKYVRAVLRDEPTAREVIAYAICFCKKWCAARRVQPD